MPDAASKLGCTQVLRYANVHGSNFAVPCLRPQRMPAGVMTLAIASALPQDGSVVAMEYDEKIATFGELPIC